MKHLTTACQSSNHLWFTLAGCHSPSQIDCQVIQLVFQILKENWQNLGSKVFQNLPKATPRKDLWPLPYRQDRVELRVILHEAAAEKNVLVFLQGQELKLMFAFFGSENGRVQRSERVHYICEHCRSSVFLLVKVSAQFSRHHHITCLWQQYMSCFSYEFDPKQTSSCCFPIRTIKSIRTLTAMTITATISIISSSSSSSSSSAAAAAAAVASAL